MQQQPMETKKIFGTTVNCMDGRAIEATQSWMKERYGVSFVDTITEPGMDGLLASSPAADLLEALERKLSISIIHHGSRAVSVVGHDECAGNPVDRPLHEEHVRQGVALVEKLVQKILPAEQVDVIGLYACADPDWHVEIVR